MVYFISYKNNYFVYSALKIRTYHDGNKTSYGIIDDRNSLIVKKHNVMTLPPPCQWGIYHGETTESDLYINHHRQR